MWKGIKNMSLVEITFKNNRNVNLLAKDGWFSRWGAIIMYGYLVNQQI